MARLGAVGVSASKISSNEGGTNVSTTGAFPFSSSVVSSGFVFPLDFVGGLLMVRETPSGP